MDEMLTTREAFEAMRGFLAAFNEREPAERREVLDLLLHWTEFEDDGQTADPAQWHDWLRAVGTARGVAEMPTPVRVTYDPEADAAYVYLTAQPLMPGRDSVPVDPPEGLKAFVVLDWKDGRIAGLEVLDARSLLHPDLIAAAT